MEGSKACAFAANRSVSLVARPDVFQFVNVARLIACALLARGLEYVRVLRRTRSSFLLLGSIQRMARKSRSVQRGDARRFAGFSVAGSFRQSAISGPG